MRGALALHSQVWRGCHQGAPRPTPQGHMLASDGGMGGGGRSRAGKQTHVNWAGRAQGFMTFLFSPGTSQARPSPSCLGTGQQVGTGHSVPVCHLQKACVLAAATHGSLLVPPSCPLYPLRALEDLTGPQCVSATREYTRPTAQPPPQLPHHGTPAAASGPQQLESFLGPPWRPRGRCSSWGPRRL